MESGHRAQPEVGSREQMARDVDTLVATVDAQYDVLLDRAAGIICGVMGDLCAISLLSDDGAALHPVGLRHRDPKVQESLNFEEELSWPSSGGISEHVLATGEPTVVPSVDPATMRAAGIWKLGFGVGDSILSLAVVAMRCAGRRIGLVAVAGGDAHPISGADTPSLQLVADRLALVVENGHLREEVDRQRSAEPDDLPDVRLRELTLREREILMMIGNGLTNRDIGEHLFLSVRTVEWHRARLSAKLGTNKRSSLTILGRMLS
jgi:DNA-binding CsgD family transcriptional regulator